MSNDQNDKVSRGRHVAPSDIPSINFDDDNQPGGFIPQQVHGQQNRQAYPQFAQTGHQGYAPSGMQIPSTGVSRPKKRVGKVLGIVAACLVAVLAIAYCGVALYFGSHFMPNTKIGNLDASLMSTADAEKALANEVNSYKLTITGNGFNLTVSAKDAGVDFNASEAVKEAYSAYNEWLWPVELTRSHDATGAMISSYNDSGLEQTVSAAVAAFNESATQPLNATVTYDSKSGSFTVCKEVAGTALDASKVMAVADAALAELDPKVVLSSEQLLQPTVFSTDLRLKTAVEQANTMIGADIVLTMGKSTAAEVNADLISQWVTVDENVQAVLDEEAMRAWVDKLAGDCDTVGTTRTYTRADGKTITVSGGVYGWSIDYDALMDLVINGVKEGLVETVEIPNATSGDAYNGVGGRDWGNRYIDIDLAEQHVYFYDDSGALAWESDCISGIPDGTHDTSVGVFWMNAMQSPGKLTGYENGQKIYESTVQYWMPFDGNAIGLHDADWQPDFGGTMYKDGYGSHGCVNLPPAKAKELYSLIHSGDCVVSHW